MSLRVVSRVALTNYDLRILRNLEISIKSLKCLEIWASAQLPPDTKILTNALESCKKSRLQHFTENPILLCLIFRIYLQCFVQDFWSIIIRGGRVKNAFL